MVVTRLGDKSTASQPGVGGEKTTVPTLETIRKGIENKAKSGIGSKPSDVIKRVLNKTKMPSAPGSVTTSQ